MKLITCPTSYTRETLSDIIVFLGGGISNCPNWQLDMIDKLTSADDSLVLVNPRRESFDINDETASDFQIKWEFKHLHASDAILFWFPCETLCPITLYELGAAAHRGNPIFVGCHPSYARRDLTNVKNKWRQLLGGRAILLSNYNYISEVIIAVMEVNEGADPEDVVASFQDREVREVVRHALFD